MKTKKLNVKKLAIFLAGCILVLILFIYGIVKIVNKIKYTFSYESKLVKVGYKLEEAKYLSKNLKENQIEKLLSREYNMNIYKFSKEKYFLFDNLDNYLTFYRTNKGKEFNKIVSIVNTKGLGEWYDEISDSNMSNPTEMIVNKKYRLPNDYVPSDLVNLESSYAYNGIKISNTIYDDLVNLLNSAKESGYKLIVSQGYRSYESQEKAYNNYKNDYSEREADEYVARPGHSEYQTGLSINIEPYNKIVDDYKTNEEFLWLNENAYKYGFILRFPEGTDDITGFESNPWRFRYVGVDLATKIYKEGITFDEYYEYYIK